MKALLSIMIIPLIFLTSCMSSEPDPVQQYQRKDYAMSCEMIQRELQTNQVQLAALAQNTSAFAKNRPTAWLYRDEVSRQQIEIQALEVRNDRLRVLCYAKGCEDSA